MSIQQDEFSIFDVSIPEDTREKLALFLEAVSEHCRFLNDLGYQGPIVKLFKHEILNFCNTILYHNDQVLREVRVKFFPAKKNDSNGDLLTLQIWRTGSESDKHASENLIAFDKFLEKYRPDIDQMSLDIRSYETPLEERLDRVLGLCASLLKNEAKEILTGECWEQSLYHEWV